MTAFGVVVAHAIVSPEGAAQDLGSLGYNYSTAAAINNNNDVIGYVLNSRSDPLTGFARIGGQMQLLPLDGTYGVQSIAYAINNSGQVVGTANIGYDHHGFVYASGVLTDLNNSVVANLHTDLNSASLINDAGQIVVHGLDGYDYLLTPNNPNTALSIASTHTGNFTQGQQNAVYTVTVSNDANAGASTGTVTVTENLPAGLTLVSMAGNGWSCPTLPTCTRGDSLSPGASYFPITVTVAVLPAATSPLLNQVTVSGGGSGKALGTDSTIVVNASSVIHFSVAPPATATAGSAISFTVTALDATNNTVGSYAGTVHFTSSDAQAVLPADSTLTSGSGAFSATFKTAGNQTLTATDNAVSSITGTSTGTVVSAAAASTTTVASNVPLTFSPSAQSITLNATVTSTSTVNNGSVAFTLLGTQVSADVTNGAASAGFTVSAGTAAGSYTIQAAYSPGTGFAASSDSTHQLQIAKATPSITWANPADISVGTALGATQLNATASVAGTFVYAPTAGTALQVGTGQTLSTIFTPTDTTNYKTAIASVLINVVSKATPVITWSNPADIVYGAALGSTQLNANANVQGTFVYTPPAGTLLQAGNGRTLSTTFTPTDSTNYTTAAKSALINVSKATPLITWAPPAPITYGGALGNGQLNASANTPGTFVYTPPAGTVLGVGNGQTLSVAFTPTDAADYTTASASTTINLNAAPLPPSGVNLVVTKVLTRTNTNVVVQLTIANLGGTAANNVTLTSVKVGSALATVLPQYIGTIGANVSAQATVSVPGSVGLSGAASTLTVAGTYSGGTFSLSARITLP